LISLGIIGLGRWGPNLLRNFASMEGVSIRMVCDIDNTRLLLIQKRYPGILCTTYPHDIFGRRDIDCVVISTPLSAHFSLARQRLESGYHVLVEKPLAASSQECEELIEIAKRKGKLLFVGHTFIYNSGIKAAKGYIERGELGKIYLIDANRTNLGPVRYDANTLWD